MTDRYLAIGELAGPTVESCGQVGDRPEASSSSTADLVIGRVCGSLGRRPEGCGRGARAGQLPGVVLVVLVVLVVRRVSRRPRAGSSIIEAMPNGQASMMSLVNICVIGGLSSIRPPCG
jgi:hypothetical protein